MAVRQLCPVDAGFAESGTGTRVSRTFAADGSKPFLTLLRTFRPVLARTFTVSMRRLGGSPTR